MRLGWTLLSFDISEKLFELLGGYNLRGDCANLNLIQILHPPEVVSFPATKIQL